MSWPPILKITAEPGFESMLRYTQLVRPLLNNISEATQYYPILGKPRGLPQL